MKHTIDAAVMEKMQEALIALKNCYSPYSGFLVLNQKRAYEFVAAHSEILKAALEAHPQAMCSRCGCDFGDKARFAICQGCVTETAIEAQPQGGREVSEDVDAVIAAAWHCVDDQAYKGAVTLGSINALKVMLEKMK